MGEFVIETNRLTKRYGVQTVVKQINLHIRKGKIYGLLGRNGAGKTTIMKMILGLTHITSGEITIFGEKICGYSKDHYSRIGSTIESPGFYPNLTATENLQVFARLSGTISRDAVENALEVVGLPYRDKKTFSQYSLGMKQRLAIANAIMKDPEILILDEPTNGLDPIGISEMRELIKRLSIERGKTILISSHQLSEIEQMVDYIGVIHDGVLLEEWDYHELVKKNRKYIYLNTTNIKGTTLILEQEYGIKNYIVEDETTIKIFDLSHNVAILNRRIIESGIDVFSIGINSSNLEDYFKTITGGVGIA